VTSEDRVASGPPGLAELDLLAHAYAVTIHRSPGSEYAVVIPLITVPGRGADRQMFRTAVWHDARPGR
jgi:hypothetical protein